MRFKIILLLVVGVSLAGSAAASLAGIWQFPLETDWDIDPEFRFGSAYAGTTHLGEDVAAPAGTPVFAAANGTVKLTANFPGYHDWGGLILIENQNVTGSVVVSLYGHLDSRSFGVVPGQTVNRGQMLGRLGDSSRNGQWKPHIHFGLRKGYYQSSPWVYRGFGSGGELSNWHPAHTYVPARAAVKEVSRVPIAGRNRYETAAAASQWQYPAAGSAGAVIIASGERYQDALAGTVLAQLRRAPLLLTQAHQVPMETVNELTRAITPGAPVYLIGGPDVVSPQVSDYLGSLGYSVERLAGLTAPETSTVVAESLPSSSTVFVASSRSFADGLSAGAPAAELGAPLLLTEPDRLSHSVGSFLQSRQPGQIYLVGGEAALSYAVSEQIKDLLPAAAVERLSGYDRYATNRFVNERFISAPKVITIASGERYQDALVGSVLA
ncbi:MAG: cell wall-binding repeat-containing protein, partial [bacterium]|nr:cell wall-binding repeat-containing protein [bacterium]